LWESLLGFFKKLFTKEKSEAEENAKKKESYQELLARLERKVEQGDTKWLQSDPGKTKQRGNDFADAMTKTVEQSSQQSVPVNRGINFLQGMGEWVPKLFALQMESMRSIIFIRRELKRHQLTVDATDLQKDGFAARDLGDDYEKWQSRNPDKAFGIFLQELSTFIIKNKKITKVTLEDVKNFSREFVS
jgi:hypothetical protein